MRRPFTIRESGVMAIGCHDLAAMTAFYRDLLGFEELGEDYPAPGVALRAPAGPSGAWGRGAAVIVLYPLDEAGGEDDEESDAGAAARQHLAFTLPADELGAAGAWLRARGIAVEERERPALGWKSLWLADPEGNTVELVAATRQRTPGQ